MEYVENFKTIILHASTLASGNLFERGEKMGCWKLLWTQTWTCTHYWTTATRLLEAWNPQLWPSVIAHMTPSTRTSLRRKRSSCRSARLLMRPRLEGGREGVPYYRPPFGPRGAKMVSFGALWGRESLKIRESRYEQSLLCCAVFMSLEFHEELSWPRSIAQGDCNISEVIWRLPRGNVGRTMPFFELLELLWIFWSPT